MSERQVVRVSLESIPEAMALMRREMANLLRREANFERNSDIAKKLRGLANAFEAGLGPVNDDIWRKP